MSPLAKANEQSGAASPESRRLQSGIIARVGLQIQQIAQRRNRQVDRNRGLHLIKEIVSEDERRARQEAGAKEGSHQAGGEGQELATSAKE